ncbi:hypothetical protein [Pantoea ananatis]|uniref:hypothetical protein n=1 Tax=Pantoea ananas TaxID=553 RepID=UPI0039B86028
MKRYSHLLAGASWMAEYGNPDTDDWKFIQTFSPPTKTYPPVIFLTTPRAPGPCAEDGGEDDRCRQG